MKVYGLYTECRFEGGNVVSIYKNEVKAISAALRMLNAERKESIRVHEEDTWEEVPPFNENVIKCWQNDLDEIVVYEYKVK